jgi:hypothetical protein
VQVVRPVELDPCIRLAQLRLSKSLSRNFN